MRVCALLVCVFVSGVISCVLYVYYYFCCFYCCCYCHFQRTIHRKHFCPNVRLSHSPEAFLPERVFELLLYCGRSPPIKDVFCASLDVPASDVLHLDVLLASGISWDRLGSVGIIRVRAASRSTRHDAVSPHPNILWWFRPGGLVVTSL